jgi:flagellar assembly protein FliH
VTSYSEPTWTSEPPFLPEGVTPLVFRCLDPDAEDQFSITPVSEIVEEPVMEVLSPPRQPETLEIANTEMLEAAFELKLHEERAVLSRTLEQFTEERRRYFEGVEGEVVRLSLAIAERVLHREVEMDPLLLAGAAKVALENVADRSGVVLRVSSSEVDAWTERMGQTSHPPELVGDHNLSRGDCVVETRMGTIDLGIRAQLKEIERGFFDLMRRRPVFGV